MNWVAFPSHSLLCIANTIDRLIVLLAFVLLIFMPAGISLMGKKAQPVGQFSFAHVVAVNERSSRAHANNSSRVHANNSSRVHANNEGNMDSPSHSPSPSPSPSPSLPIVSVEENSLDVDSLPEAVQEQDDYDKAKKYCNNFPGRPANDSSQSELCTHLFRAIEYSGVCVNLYQNVSAKRKHADFAKEMRIWYTRAQNLKAEHTLRCGAPDV
jgi:hypothetical protein